MSVAFQSRPARNFTTKPLGEVFDVVGGGTPPKNNASYFRGDIPWATIRDMHSEILAETEHTISEEGLRSSSAKLIPAGEVIMASRVGLGKACILQRDTAINQDIRALLPLKPNTVDRRFCLYWLQSVKDDIIAAGTGATVQGIKLPFIKSLPFPDVPLEEQKRIVAMLDQAFVALDRARTLAETNLEDTIELNRSVQAHALGDKGNWEEAQLSDLIKVRSGSFLPKNAMNVSGKIPVFGGNGKTGFHDISNLTGQNILIGRVGAKCGNVHVVDEPIWVTDNAFFVKEIHRDFDLEFLAFALEHADLRSAAKQAAQPVITGTSIGPIRIRYPAKVEEQREYLEALRAFEGRTKDLSSHYQAMIAHTSQLRESLLHRAFTGELT